MVRVISGNKTRAQNILKASTTYRLKQTCAPRKGISPLILKAALIDHLQTVHSVRNLHLAMSAMLAKFLEMDPMPLPSFSNCIPWAEIEKTLPARSWRNWKKDSTTFTSNLHKLDVFMSFLRQEIDLRDDIKYSIPIISIDDDSRTPPCDTTPDDSSDDLPDIPTSPKGSLTS